MGIDSTMINRIMMIVYRIAPSPTRRITPAPSPIVPTIVTMAIVRSIPTIPRIVPRVVPSIAVIPIPRVNKMDTMITI
jgi:hypothetical protein